MTDDYDSMQLHYNTCREVTQIYEEKLNWFNKHDSSASWDGLQVIFDPSVFKTFGQQWLNVYKDRGCL